MVNKLNNINSFDSFKKINESTNQDDPWKATNFKLYKLDKPIDYGCILGYEITYKDIKFNSGNSGLRNIKPAKCELTIIDGTVHWRHANKDGMAIWC